MNIKERILKSEEEFPKAFTSFIEKDYGILYYNENDKESHDSNHAILYPDKISGLELVLCEIKNFYSDKAIKPMIYQPAVKGYFVNHREALENMGFEIEVFGNNNYMLLTNENNIIIENKLSVKRLREWDEHIASDIFVPNGEEYEVEVVKNLLKFRNSYVFVGYLNEIAVATVYFHISDYGCTCFDYIATAKAYRGRGYAREILSCAVDFCRENNIHDCYQWPAHKTSERICHEAGFRVLFEVEAAVAVYSGK